jgi:hypothetical protein
MKTRQQIEEKIEYLRLNGNYDEANILYWVLSDD